MRPPRQLILPTIAVLAAALPACGDTEKTIVTPEVLLYFDTDAPLPSQTERASSVTDVVPLFDRLRVDVFPPRSSTPCDGCTNEFEVDAELFRQGRASIGLLPPVDVAGYRARVRLFKAAFANSAGQPDPSSTIDVTVALPTTTPDSRVERTVNLATDDVGTPVGSLTAPIEPANGAPKGAHVGTWAGAKRVDCAGAAPEGSVCVPGGAFWMGDPNSPGFLLALDAHSVALESTQPRLVVVSPFFMQTTEVTVRQYRASGLPLAGGWTGSRSGTSAGDWCTYTTTPGDFEAMPLNCVSAFEARAYCTQKGADLPTEAQFAYASGALASRLFVWGRDTPTCDDAVFGRAGWGVLTSLVSPCRPDEPPGWFAPPGSGARDRVELPGGTILDVAGNLSEWTNDFWNRLEEPCWQRTGVYHDPKCTSLSPADGPLITVRGGNWTAPFNMMQSTKRRGIDPNEKSISSGFRCVWRATSR